MNIKDYQKEYDGPDLSGFKKFSFQLDHFQKYAIQAIDSHENVLVMAGTGSGKTVCAEYAIEKAIELNKKVIYTSPIKSLSNQKFNEFNKKYDGNRVGILTGDIKYNPEAQILIMTTEILRNLLYQDEIKLDPVSGESLKINIKEEVSSVIFDEVHYINDPDRGKVWEESLILLPKCVDLVLLSATISGAERFGCWLQNIKQKPLVLTGNKQRVIPLKHYYFLNTRNLGNKGLPIDDETRKFLEKYSNQLVPILDDKFYEENIHNLFKIKNKHRTVLNRDGVINSISNYLKDKKMLPAIFFIFSRKRCEKYANMLDISFNDSEEQSNVEKIINFHIRKLDYPESYLHLPQFLNLKKLLMKGIAYHHSGLIPVLKEIIEILFAKNLVKVLMATETFAVGINMPTKTVVFTALDKYDSSGNNRWLRTHEYLQMSGRAGRRGMDKVGFVIHLPNISETPNTTELRNMMMGKPQTIKSRFNLNYQFLLKAILTENIELDQIIRASLWNQEMEGQLNVLKIEKEQYLEFDNNKYQDCLKYEQLLETTLDGFIKLDNKSIKKNKDKAKKMMTPAFKLKYKKYQQVKKDLNKLNQLENEINGLETGIESNLFKITKFLQDLGYISSDWNPENAFNINKSDITMKGIMASEVNQCQELFLTEIISQGIIDNLNSYELAGFLSIFTDYKANNNNNFNNNDNENTGYGDKYNLDSLWNAINYAENIGVELDKEEEKRGIILPSEWFINDSLVILTYKWAKDGVELKTFNLTDIFAGEFIKEMIKISHIAEEVGNLADIMGKNQLKLECQKVSSLIIKDVVGIDSLYIKNI